MSKRGLNIHDIVTARWFITDEAAERYMPYIIRMMTGEPVAYADDDDDPDRPRKNMAELLEDRITEINSRTEGHVEVLGISGAIMKNDYCGDFGTSSFAKLITAAAANPNISGIVLNLDTPGGDANAVEIITAAINAAKEKKPVIAYVDGYAASAGYWMASSCTEIVMAGNLSSVGSIGAYQRFADWSKRYEAYGVKIRDIYSRLSPKKNAEYRAALEGNDDPVKDSLDKLVTEFHSVVKAGRPNIENSVLEGGMYITEEAIAAGLADRKGTIDDAIAAASANYTHTHNHNFIMKKVSISAAFASLLSFFGASTKEGETFAEVDWTEEKQRELNGKLASVTQLESDLTAANAKVTDLTTANGNLTTEKTTLETKVSELEAKIAKLPGGAASITHVEKETPAAEVGNNNTVIDESHEHNALAAAAGY